MVYGKHTDNSVADTLVQRVAKCDDATATAAVACTSLIKRSASNGIPDIPVVVGERIPESPGRGYDGVIKKSR